MEFITSNLLNTTTQLVLPANTFAGKNIFGQDTRTQYFTDNFDDDNTTASITINFDSTTSVSRISLLEHNLKGFTFFYNSATANTFSITTTSSTIASDFSTNSETSMILICNTAQVSSITLDMKTTQTADAEKALGRLLISDTVLDFDRIPSSKNYKPMYRTTEVIHRMSDGGKRIQFIQNKHDVEIKFKHLSLTMRNSLKDVYDLRTSFIFVAFPTATGWDEMIFDAVWQGNFEFFRYSDDSVDSGYSGRIRLEETSL